MSLQFDNTAEMIGERAGQPYYQWEVFLDESPEVCEQISEVEYILHPTFPEPVQVRRDPSDRFALRTGSWGAFRLRMRVTFKDRHYEDLSYQLDLSKRKREPVGASR